MNEIWKTIPDFEQYQVSNLGRVRRWQRKNKLWYYLKLNIPKSSTVKYYLVALRSNGKTKRFLVHRLVAMAFLPNPDNLPQVNHKDECKTNNFVFINPDGTVDHEKSNLEWCSVSYNNTYNDKMKCRKKPVLQLKNGVVIKEYCSETEAGVSVDRGANAICQAIKNNGICGGYQWRYK